MARQLKVYRTVAGFHDAYVAAASQKAALAAWGSDKDLFARGDAERVEDPALMAAPLADPGTVIRLSRGTTAAQIAAMPDPPSRTAMPDPPSHPTARHGADDARHGADDAGHAPPGKPKRAKPAAPAEPSKPPRPPRPSRDRLIAAEEALDTCLEAQRAERRALEQREAQLALERRTLERRHHADEAAMRQALDDAKDDYATAMQRWKA